MTDTQSLRCYFDIVKLREIHRDHEGVEVSDVDDAIAQARCAIAELDEAENKELRRALSGERAFLIMRDTAETLLCVIRLDG
jgi:hypothetical protein